MISVAVTVRTHGPFFSGVAEHAITEGLAEAVWQVGAQGYANVMTILNQRIKHPTPYYETQVIAERSADTVVVHDRGIIYGPWLEGVGSRNRTTRFKGYHAFREGTQELQHQAASVAEHALRPYIARMR